MIVNLVFMPRVCSIIYHERGTHIWQKEIDMGLSNLPIILAKKAIESRVSFCQIRRWHYHRDLTTFFVFIGLLLYSTYEKCKPFV